MDLVDVAPRLDAVAGFHLPSRFSLSRYPLLVARCSRLVGRSSGREASGFFLIFSRFTASDLTISHGFRSTPTVDPTPLRMKRVLAALATALLVTSLASGQITLTGTSYTENFDAISGGLPAGWSVTTTASLSTLGAAASLTTASTNWNSAVPGGPFRNIASSNIAYGSLAAVQTADTNRALGWRPLDAATRDGAVTLNIGNTANLTDFSLGLTVFQSNDTSSSQNSYALEYRVGNSGNFTQLGSSFVTNTTGLTDYLSVSYSVTGASLAPIADQNDNVFIRLRGLGGASSSADTIGIDNFSLSYAAIPEPSTYGALFGLLSLGIVVWRRRVAVR